MYICIVCLVLAFNACRCYCERALSSRCVCMCVCVSVSVASTCVCEHESLLQVLSFRLMILNVTKLSEYTAWRGAARPRNNVHTTLENMYTIQFICHLNFKRYISLLYEREKNEAILLNKRAYFSYLILLLFFLFRVCYFGLVSLVKY